jgi:hypothetical protein
MGSSSCIDDLSGLARVTTYVKAFFRKLATFWAF